MSKGEKIAKQLNLLPHPEGGFYRETYRSSGILDSISLGPSFTGKRNFSTCIYFLLTSNTFSAFHKIKQDEIWHFYKGAPIKLHIIDTKGAYKNIIIGNNLSNYETPQFIVNANNWFAAEVMESNSYSLLGCTVSPGFDFKDFELANRISLTKEFPEHSRIIERLTRD
ncbi:cupin domain-containing protein [Cognatitamlana onchidii]|uniref:cupin domain-containing protein n=1 Tax=Cognatitamlana onchidii TaxID=2562860 RepID=UPI0010A5C82C|nr:cupin domain-containing protein [Algibacter onchidii]